MPTRGDFSLRQSLRPPLYKRFLPYRWIVARIYISCPPQSQCPPSRSSLSQLRSLTNSTVVSSDLIPREPPQKLPNKSSNALSTSLKSKTLNMLPMLSLAVCTPPSLVASKLPKLSTWTIWEVVYTQNPSSPVTSRS